MDKRCAICGNDFERGNRCCAKEISYLRSRLNTQSRTIEKIEDERDTATRKLAELQAKVETLENEAWMYRECAQ